MYESHQGAVHYQTLYTKKVVRFVTSSKTRHIAGTHWVIRVKMVTWLKCTSLWVLWSQRLILAFLMVDFVKNLTTFHLVHYSVFTPVSTLIVLYMKHDLWGMSQGFSLTQALLTGFVMVSAFPTFWLPTTTLVSTITPHLFNPSASRPHHIFALITLDRWYWPLFTVMLIFRSVVTFWMEDSGIIVDIWMHVIEHFSFKRYFLEFHSFTSRVSPLYKRSKVWFQ